MAFPDTDVDVIIEAFLGADPTADPGTWPAPEDLSSRLLAEPITITRGRRPGQKTAAAGSCSFILDNDDGALTPLLATSSYFPGWDLGVPVRVSVDNVGSMLAAYPRFCGYAAQIEPTVVPKSGGGTTSAVRVELGGKLRQLTQGSVPKSALRRTIVAAEPTVAYLFEGGSLAESFAVSVGSGDPIMIFPGSETVGGGTVEAGGDSGVSWLPPGLLMTCTDSGDEAVVVARTSALSASPTRLVADLAFVLHDTCNVLLFLSVDDKTNSTNFSVGAGTGTNTVGVSAVVGGSLADSASVAATIARDTGHHLRLDVSQDGANVDVLVYLDGVQVISDTFASVTLAQYRSIIVATNAGASANATIHLAAVWEGVPLDVTTASAAATSGYAGEQAHVRFLRVCAEEGIAGTCTATESRPVGPQPIADVVAVLQDLETVDHGILSETINDWGLGYRSGDQRYNLDPSLTVDLDTYRVSGGDSPTVVMPSRNDQRFRNEWTITRTDGATVTVKDEASIAKRGRYNDSATVNVYTDDDALLEASWR